MQGRIVGWNDEKGFGFIEAVDGRHHYFHISDVTSRTRPRNGDRANFRLARGDQGQSAARKVSIDTQRPATPSGDRASRGLPWRWALAAALIASLALGAFLRSLPVYFPLGYGIMSLVSFLTYAADKNAAEAGRLRVPEGTLLLLDCAGGIIGGLMAQETLRHKTRKPAFIVSGILLGALHLAVMWVFILPRLDLI